MEVGSGGPGMKQEVALDPLKSPAGQLGVGVSYEPLQQTVGSSRSGGGLCRVKGQYRIIVDKRATSDERVVTLASALSTFDTSELELPDNVREILRLHAGRKRPAA